MTSSHRAERVAVVGTLNLDQVVRVDRLPADGETVLGVGQSERSGGKGANQAAAAAAVAPTALIGAVGEDSAGTAMLDDQRAAGVNVEGVRQVPGLSGRAVIEVDAEGANRIVVLSGANAELTAEHVTSSLDALAPDVVVTQLESPIAVTRATAQWCRAHDTRLVLNPSPIAPLDDSILAVADPLVVNEVEAAYYGGGSDDPAAGTPDSSAADLGTRCRSVVVTLGGAGVLVSDDASVTRIDVRRVHATDTTGAGDVFAGTLAAHLATGVDLRAAAQYAATAATDFVTTHRG
ncbi:ribokinase [Gordonia sp. DT219]|uniref:ribokinase n=1 Tax=Gordonia sp. DT219 TaxID=3416658 RepID=UPI003CF415BB